jgi:hypothetical protein
MSAAIAETGSAIVAATSPITTCLETRIAMGGSSSGNESSVSAGHERRIPRFSADQLKALTLDQV